MHVARWPAILFSAEADSNDSDDNNGVIIALATVMAIAVIGLVISIVINVFIIVKLKQSRCVVTSTFYVAIVDYFCRYDVNQNTIRYSDVKQSVSRDYTSKDAKSFEPLEYTAIETNYKPDSNIKMVDPAYHTVI